MSCIVMVFDAEAVPHVAPTVTAYETAIDGRFQLHVEVRHALAGLIVRYQGWLERVSEAR